MFFMPPTVEREKNRKTWQGILEFLIGEFSGSSHSISVFLTPVPRLFLLEAVPPKHIISPSAKKIMLQLPSRRTHP